jgi:hypothetical protein
MFFHVKTQYQRQQYKLKAIHTDMGDTVTLAMCLGCSEIVPAFKKQNHFLFGA